MPNISIAISTERSDMGSADIEGIHKSRPVLLKYTLPVKHQFQKHEIGMVCFTMTSVKRCTPFTNLAAWEKVAD